MPARGYGRAVVLGWVALMATPASALADELVLVAPVQGSAALRSEFGDHVPDAVRRALEARGYSVAASRAPMGQAVVACQTPECVEQALDAAEAAFAIVPAVWSRSSGGPELTLTLVQRSGHNLNATNAGVRQFYKIAPDTFFIDGVPHPPPAGPGFGLAGDIRPMRLG